MVEREVINTHRGELGFAWKENKLRGPLLVDTWIVFVVALLLDQALPRATLAAVVDEGCLFAHVAGERRSIISKARRVAD